MLAPVKLVILLGRNYGVQYDVVVCSKHFPESVETLSPAHFQELLAVFLESSKPQSTTSNCDSVKEDARENPMEP